MTKHTIRRITAVASLFFGINIAVPLIALAQFETTSTVGQMIDASAGALTMPCSPGNFSLQPLEIGSPDPTFSSYYINPLNPDFGMTTCGGSGIRVQDTRYDGGFVLQVTATDYVKVGAPGTTIGVENLAIVTEQLSTSYNEDASGGNSFVGNCCDVLLAGSQGDDVEISQLLPFTFTFYGVDYTTVYLCSNGVLNFQSGNCNPPVTPYANHLTDTGGRILAYYKDLTTSAAVDPAFGIFYVSPSATEARFRWQAGIDGAAPDATAFEITLTDNGIDDTVTIHYGYGWPSEITDTGEGPIVGVTKGGAAGTPVTTTYTESILSRHEIGADLLNDHTAFIPGGFDFLEVKKPTTPAATAPLNGDSGTDLDYVYFTEDVGNPGTSLAMDLIDGTVQDGACFYTPGRVGLYVIYPSYRLTVANAAVEGTYQSTITYTISDSTLPPPICPS
ncbi:MAG TPA: hypothetical protein VI588_05210 [Candidatus Gracilibacteria bacterium]|nr:hypothetical protein [Candidatus Gracilibacteria bacterium]